MLDLDLNEAEAVAGYAQLQQQPEAGAPLWRQVSPVPDVRQDRCWGCGEPVLVAYTDPPGLTGPLVLERQEVEPEHRCPTCRAGRDRDPSVVCWRCGDTCKVGEPVPRSGVAAINAYGAARPLGRGQPLRQRGEAVHRYHQCPLDAA